MRNAEWRSGAAGGVASGNDRPLAARVRLVSAHSPIRNPHSAFRLMLVTDRSLFPSGGLAEAVDSAVSGGVDAVQLREKDLPDDELIALGRELRAVTRGRALLLVNGTTAQAIACDADGLHLPESAPPVAPGHSAFRIPHSAFLLGRSVHDAGAARLAVAEGVDYLVLGTVFPSSSHPGGMTGGLDLIRRVRAAVDTPIIAIGGITAATAASVLDAGASGVAVISAILAAADPRAAALELRAVIDQALGVPTGEHA
jgi:thiamine-phosphate pyrophosphorylase